MPKKNGNFPNMQDFFEDIQSILGHPPDLVCRSLIVQEEQAVHCIYLNSMADKMMIDDYILRSLTERTFAEGEAPHSHEGVFLREYPFSDPYEALREHAVKALISGHCVLIDFPGERVCLINAVEPKQRAIEEPKAEATIRGPHEGFSESIMTNVGLVRKRIRNPSLRFEKMSVGSQTKTTLFIVYMANLAPEPLVREVRERLRAIRTDSVLDSAYVEEFIQDRIWSPFPTLTNTERPDVMAAQLLDGKVAVMVDGTPGVLIAPVTFFEFFSSPEDYYQRADIATFIRWIRLISFFTAVFVPSLYVAATTFHQELIPTRLLISLSAQREGVPFPAIFEVLLMEIMFEIIREAGLRMPRAVGQALSIVGAIVLGQAAVEAGLISAAIVIVVAITGITNFVVPIYSFGMSQRLLRFSFVLLAGFMGLFGVLCGALALTAHLVSLKSFGVPYMTPASPVKGGNWKDVLLRVPRPWLDPNGLPEFIRDLKRKR
jgi:spore germination protein KA